MNDGLHMFGVPPEKARKEAHDRQAILASLSQKLKGGGVSLVENKGYRRYVSAE